MNTNRKTFEESKNQTVPEAPTDGRPAWYKGKAPFDPDFKKKSSGRGRGNDMPKPKPTLGHVKLNIPASEPSKPKGLSNNPTPTKDDPMWKEAIFSSNISIREVEVRKQVNVNLGSFPEMVERTSDFIFRADQQLDKVIPREAIRYYSTALLWMRIIETKENASLQLTDEERTWRDLYQHVEYNIPEPVYMYLHSFGRVLTLNGERYDPAFPPLPNQVSGNTHGVYGPYEAHHLLYEEVPTLGIVAESCRQSASNAAAGPYAVDIAPYPAAVANANLLGYRPLLHRRAEAKNMLIRLGIGQNVFPEDILNTSINLALIQQVSEALKEIKAFKVFTTTLPNLPPDGQRSMLLPSTPADQRAPIGTTYYDGDFKTQSLNRDTTITFGVASIMLLQAYKENNPGQPIPANAWLSFNYDVQHPPPAVMIASRNDRRDVVMNCLPPRFRENVFESISMNARERRNLLLESIVNTRS